MRRTENLFIRHGVRALLVAKFLPGLTTVMPPLAGVFGVPRLRFALYDLAGVVLWAGLWAGIGYVFSDAIEEVARRVSALGRTAGLVVAGTLVDYVLLKYRRRRLFLRRLRIARISPEDLKRKLEAGEDVAIRSHERPGGASAPASGNHPRPTARRRGGGVDGPEEAGRTLGLKA